VERFGLLATTEKNAKLQLIFCALYSPPKQPSRLFVSYLIANF